MSRVFEEMARPQLFCTDYSGASSWSYPEESLAVLLGAPVRTPFRALILYACAQRTVGIFEPGLDRPADFTGFLRSSREPRILPVIDSLFINRWQFKQQATEKRRPCILERFYSIPG